MENPLGDNLLFRHVVFVLFSKLNVFSGGENFLLSQFILIKSDEKGSPGSLFRFPKVYPSILFYLKVVQVDFEGRNPIDSDFHGIKQLLNQLFLKAHLNLSELTDIIIGQNYVGSVIKQSMGDEEEDSDDEGDDVNDVFGITTVINLTEKQVGNMADFKIKFLITFLSSSSSPLIHFQYQSHPLQNNQHLS